jgi:hypothetical protein
MPLAPWIDPGTLVPVSHARHPPAAQAATSRNGNTPRILDEKDQIPLRILTTVRSSMNNAGMIQRHCQHENRRLWALMGDPQRCFPSSLLSRFDRVSASALPIAGAGYRLRDAHYEPRTKGRIMGKEKQKFSVSYARTACTRTGYRVLEYRDLGVDATHGEFRAHVVRVKRITRVIRTCTPGLHQHLCDFRCSTY